MAGIPSKLSTSYMFHPTSIVISFAYISTYYNPGFSLAGFAPIVHAVREQSYLVTIWSVTLNFHPSHYRRAWVEVVGDSVHTWCFVS